MTRGHASEPGREGVIKKQNANSSLQVPDSLRPSRGRLVHLLARLIISGLALFTVPTLAHSQNSNGWTFFDAAPPVPPEIYTSSPLQGVWDVETRDNPYIEALTILVHPPNSSLPFQQKGNPLAAHAIWHLKGEAGFWRDAFMVTLESGDDGGVAAALMEVTGYGVAAFWLSLTDAAVGVGMGGVGVYEYYQGESLYEMARGAEPVLGEDILHAAIRNRKSELMTALGVLLPMASGSANIYAFRQSDLHNLRYLKNIRTGEDIVRRNAAVLENLNDLTRAERTNVTSYYMDLLRRSETPGLGALSATHAEDLAMFNAHFERLGISSPTLRDVPAPAPMTDPTPSSAGSTPEPPSAPPPAPFDPDATVVVDPNTTDPNMMATTIGPAVPQPAVTLYDFPRVQVPNPNAAADIFEQVPGARLLERGIDEGQIQRIIERSRLGEEVTADDMLDRIDAMRVQRLNSQSPPPPEPE